MRMTWGVLIVALALLAVASVSAHHPAPTHHHTHYHQAPHTSSSNYWYSDTRHVDVYRHHYTTYYVPAPRGYPHVQHRRTHTTYTTYYPERSYRDCYRRNARWYCR